MRRLKTARSALDARATAADAARREGAVELTAAASVLVGARRDLEAVLRRARALRARVDAEVARLAGGQG